MKHLWLEEIFIDISMETNETSRNKASSRDHMDEVPALLTLVQTLNLYYLPTLVSLGLALHVFCCVVFRKTRLRHKFFTQLFLAEFVADIGFLLTLLLLWLDDSRGYEIYAVPGVCPIVVFASHFFPFLSIWMSMSSAVLLTLRPCIRCVNKFTADKGNGRIIVICFVVFTLTAYLYKTWTNGVLVVHGRKYCTVLQEARDAMKILNVLDIIVLLILPFVGFVVFNAIVFVRRFGWLCSKFRRKPGPHMRCSSSKDPTRVVCIETIGFILLVGPGCVSKFVFHVMGGPVGAETHVRDLLLQNLFQYLFYTYFAITPVLHISASSSFRDHVRVAMKAPQKTRSVSTRVDRIFRSDPISDLTLL